MEDQPDKHPLLPMMQPALDYYICAPLDPKSLETQTYRISVPVSTRKKGALMTAQILKAYTLTGHGEPTYHEGQIVIFRPTEAQANVLEPDPRNPEELYVFIHERTILGTIEFPEKGVVQ